jgi:hypothetical protein
MSPMPDRLPIARAAFRKGEPARYSEVRFTPLSRNPDSLREDHL